MLMRDEIKDLIKKAAPELGHTDIDVTYPDAKFGDYTTNAALVLSKILKQKPLDVAKSLVEKIDKSKFETVEIAGPGFINFKLKIEELYKDTPNSKPSGEKILVEYFQPNIAKPMHVGLLRTTFIGDAIKRMLKFVGANAESDTHMGDWGTQFGFLILAYKKFGGELFKDSRDPINELNQLYVKINNLAEKDPSIREAAKQEFVKLERHDIENVKIWQQFVDWSMETFKKINPLFDILPFDHHWPESFYEDKMPQVLKLLKSKSLLTESQGAQVVHLEQLKLGVAIIVKSDGGTTYLLRDLATFLYAQKQGYAKHLYVVDNRQAHHYHQLFAILKLLGNFKHNEGIHINYGFISFKGEALSTRKGNMVLAEDVLLEAKNRVAKIIEEKNPELSEKDKVVRAVAIGALKYFDLSHNRHSDIEFDWDKVLDFEGDSGPYLQYSHARLSGILNKSGSEGNFSDVQISATEREILFKASILSEIVADSLKDYLPNTLTNYLMNLAMLVNKFYHESPVMGEKDLKLKNFRLALVLKAKKTLAQGLNLLGIDALDEM